MNKISQENLREYTKRQRKEKYKIIKTAKNIYTMPQMPGILIKNIRTNKIVTPTSFTDELKIRRFLTEKKKKKRKSNAK